MALKVTQGHRKWRNSVGHTVTYPHVSHL